MRGYCILLLLLVTLLALDTEGTRKRLWRRRRCWCWRRVWRSRRWLHVRTAKPLKAVRDVDTSSVDANKVGTIDHAEAMTLTGEERDARDLLSQADLDGDSLVTTEEFERALRDLADTDEFDEYMSDED